MTQSIRFDNWVWDPHTLELRNGSHVVTLEPRVAKLFEYMVAHPGELLSRDRLVDAVWDGRVVSDEAVRQAVFSLRQALAAGGGDSYIRTVHKKGYVATFPQTVAGGPEAPLAVATAGVATTPRRRLLFGIVAAVALLAVVLTRFDTWWEHQTPATHAEAPVKAPATIAVLPFYNFSEEPASELLADGLTEELFGTLERNRALRVSARSSAFRFTDPQRDVPDIGRRLGVDYVLEGSVHSTAEGVEVQAQLVDTATGTQLWTETYAHATADWFMFQQDIVMDVARSVQSALQKGDDTVAQSSRATNQEAQLELLRARQLLITRSVADAEEAIEHLQRALTLDPSYALAYARLADAILIQAEATGGIKAARPVVAPLLDRALVLDPGLGEAYALRSRLTDDTVAAERDLHRGLELNPSYARGYEMLATLLLAQWQRMDQALASIDRAIALDPLTPGNFHSKATLLMWQGNFSEAIALERRALELNPKFLAAVMQMGRMTAIVGNFAEAIDYLEQAVALDPRSVPLRNQLLELYLLLGDVDSARAVNTPPTALDQLGILWAAGDIEPAAGMVYGGEFGPLETLAPELVSHILLDQALSDGNFARALAQLSTALPFKETLPPQMVGWRWGFYAYANLAQLLAASGDTSAASRLQTEIEKGMAADEELFPRHVLLNDQVRALLLAYADRSDEACALLDRTYTPAPRFFWKLVLSNPAFDGMRSTPCFQTLRSRIEKHIAGERVRIDAMRRAGQIPDRSTAVTD